MATGTIAVALAAALLAAWAVLAYNRLVRLRNQVRNAWADVDVQLIRRHDLVPALVSAVQAYAGHEQPVLSAVTGLRAQAIATRATATLGNIEAALEQGVGRLLASGGRDSRL
ncbi:MAG: LemA family protein [Lysobacteraceae bacterium]|nr:MAG: LemA family protein [Xanthomonadaceae bacterium]